VLLSRAEGLEQEQLDMQTLCQELAGIEKSENLDDLERARHIIAKLRSMNNRWNIGPLNAFIKERQRDLFF
jgi:hypothetical protein